jgi:predicted NBD/HSP70 family sugar kinase
LALNLNARRVLSLILERGPISRAEVARTIDLSTPSVFRICDALFEQELLVAGGPRAAAGPGQPSLPLSVAPDAAFSFGLSLTTDTITMVLADLTGQVRARRVIEGDVADRIATTRRAATGLAELLAETGADPGRVVGIGFAAPGYFVGPGPELNLAGGLDEWSLVDLESELGEAFGYAVQVENEGNAAAIGESLYGHGVNNRSFAYVSIGYGLGGGLVFDGAPLRGAHGNAGELTTILPQAMRADRPTLLGLLDHLRAKGLPLAGIGDLVARFDPAWPIDEWLERCRAPLSQILSAVAGVGDPDLIVIGGLAPQALIRRLIEVGELHLERPRRGVERPLPRILASALGADAMALGAAALPFRAHLFTPWIA